MAAGLVFVNVVFVLFVVVAIAGGLMWAVRTAHRDHIALPHLTISRAERAPTIEKPVLAPDTLAEEREPVGVVPV